MDVAWVILDALSFEATPFADDGPETMPNLSRLATEGGVVFERAYAPGTASPSSHASMFTGELPTTAGMHEASPHYDGEFPTIAEALSPSHRSFLVSYNPFVFNGLDRGFDRTNDLRGAQYMVFEDLTDPREFLLQTRDLPRHQRYLQYLREDGAPLQSLINGFSYKWWQRNNDFGRPERIDAEDVRFQYTAQMNEEIRSFLAEPGDALLVANYMDIHPPLDASDEALDRFASDTPRSELPIGTSSSEILDQVRAGDDDAADRMESLYRAAVWDVDRKVTPLIRELVEDGAFVIVTADHGSRFTTAHPLGDRRTHVPLIAFSPDHEARTVSTTVNLRSLPHTTMRRVAPQRNDFPGYDLLEVTDDQVSITEYIHGSSATGNDVSAFGEFDAVQLDVAAVRGDSRLTWIDGVYDAAGSDTDPELRTAIEERRRIGFGDNSGETIEYDEATEQRLEDLGYL